ncbi:undecaprenyl/decaprenyl-phosphate alpha-N-acetylglucosaminyl 1-phosphate transferase [Ornithinibacillus gellani]|uniref:MraY family glycosyltransferase n=1 Tax=Ornithinibacillus gellani TaxID=2293253 RepID=UPI000F4A639F|nr:MraY family glycosyltransferase [Ornithinibacillus gellani]TQS71256.1 undecaprenyl/decaprenyl-phosphate alpha-N-acetylglucosaminyl 1-phosphate transferase [Ornithinibacillus gellani]
MINLFLLACLTMFIALVITPAFIKIAKRWNWTDLPNNRKVHKDPIPTLGGIAIFISFIIGLIITQPEGKYHVAILAGAVIVLIVGILDDLFELSPKAKLIGQLLAAGVVVFGGGLQVEFINLPFGGQVEFGILSTVFTILWIVGITNAINLIDGMDGLAGGVSAIALLTIAAMAMIISHVYVFTMAIVLFFSTIGFLRYNFYPARIFMGDTGALFLGYMISVLALLGFKNVAIISFVIPIFILGVPIADTLIAIVRRYINKQPISGADKSHLHHRLMKLGFTHKQTVLFIYGLSLMFSVTAILFSMTTVWGSILIFTIAILTVQILIESLGLINNDFKPLTKFVKGFWHK